LHPAFANLGFPNAFETSGRAMPSVAFPTGEPSIMICTWEIGVPSSQSAAQPETVTLVFCTAAAGPFSRNPNGSRLAVTFRVAVFVRVPARAAESNPTTVIEWVPTVRFEVLRANCQPEFKYRLPKAAETSARGMPRVAFPAATPSTRTSTRWIGAPSSLSPAQPENVAIEDFETLAGPFSRNPKGALLGATVKLTVFDN